MMRFTRVGGFVVFSVFRFLFAKGILLEGVFRFVVLISDGVSSSDAWTSSD
jgi:hypothetical protein